MASYWGLDRWVLPWMVTPWPEALPEADDAASDAM